MGDTINNIESRIVLVEPTTKEGFRLRAVEVAADIARQRMYTTGVNVTTDDIVRSANKIYSFVERGF